jgi:hypothetical protein
VGNGGVHLRVLTIWIICHLKRTNIVSKVSVRRIILICDEMKNEDQIFTLNCDPI